jgi:hypothetical protein
MTECQAAMRDSQANAKKAGDSFHALRAAPVRPWVEMRLVVLIVSDR